MKKIQILCSLMLLCAGLCRAQHAPLEIAWLSWWDAQYPTVTWGGNIAVSTDSKKAVDYVASLLDAPTAADRKYDWRLSEQSIPVGSRLVAIDGQPVLGLRLSQMEEKLRSANEVRVLLPLSDKESVVRIGGELPMWMQAYGFHPLSCVWKKTRQTPPANMVIRMDKEVPWGTFKTYDFMILSADVLADKELLEKIGRAYARMGFRRDTENPDVLITITKDANKSVEYTYVPETTERVHTGTNTQAIYGYGGRYLGNFSVNKYQTVKSGGYTQKTATTTLYLEVSVLQASRMGESVVPMIYQMKYNYTNNSDENVDKLYANAVSWVEHPLMAEVCYRNSTTCTRFFYENLPLVNFGIVADAEGVVRGADPNSEVVRSSGIQKGDKILRIKTTEKESMSHLRSKTTYSGTITVERNGQQLPLHFLRCHRTNHYQLTCVGY
ncbi:MAG: hypothetical protein J5873_03160 [Bacteroidales bacterium]|nr:hypothetical protein [Bacteroidales bacterium]